jgi:hypothetical protein
MPPSALRVRRRAGISMDRTRADPVAPSRQRPLLPIAWHKQLRPIRDKTRFL